MTEKLRTNSFVLTILMTAVLCAAGGFYSAVSLFCTVVLSVLLIITVFRRGEIFVGKNIYSLFCVIFVFGYLATTAWGVDKFNSALGFFKYLPVLLFSLFITQLEREERNRTLGIIPYLGALMTVVSFVFTSLDKAAYLFSVSGRISGFLEYSNTFALLLIIGIIIIAFKEKCTIVDYIITVILIAGVFLTGSRASFILLVVVIIALLITGKSKGFKIGVSVMLVVAVAGALIYFAATGKHGAFARFLTISSSSGTFLGRLLYFKDAARVILKHPFGLGYMGYYFMQGSFQTGVYSNQFVHNELLQIMLDIGWLPSALAVSCVIKSFLSGSLPLVNKLILGAIVLHSMMDFDLQFIGIFFIIPICLDLDENRVRLDVRKPLSVALAVLLTAVCVLSGWLVLSDTLYVTSKIDRSISVCKANTMAQLEAMESIDDIGKKSKKADIIIKNNKYVSNAYSAKALYYYEQGDIQKTIEYKKKAIQCNRYFSDEYADYAVMLINTAALYSQMEDYDSASYCCEELMSLDAAINEVLEGTDDIAYRLQDKPELELPEECRAVIDEIREANS